MILMFMRPLNRISHYNRKDDENDFILHLRQLSTGHPHPLAKRSEIKVGSSGLSRLKSAVMAIVGSFLMLRLSLSDSRSNSLLLVDWMTGDILLVCTFMMSQL